MLLISITTMKLQTWFEVCIRPVPCIHQSPCIHFLHFKSRMSIHQQQQQFMDHTHEDKFSQDNHEIPETLPI